MDYNYIKEEDVGLWSQLHSRMHLKKSNHSSQVLRLFGSCRSNFLDFSNSLSHVSGGRPLKVCVLNKWLLNGCVDGQNRWEKVNKWIWRRIKERRWQYHNALASAAVKLHQGGRRKRGCAPLRRVLRKMDGGWGIKTEQTFGFIEEEEEEGKVNKRSNMFLKRFSLKVSPTLVPRISLWFFS